MRVFVLISIITFLNGCSTFDVATTALKVVDIKIDKKVSVIIPPKPKLTKNWNKPEPVVEKAKPPLTITEEPEKVRTNFPWWLILIAFLSGSYYIINSRKL
jgi:hypothetical protein